MLKHLLEFTRRQLSIAHPQVRFSADITWVHGWMRRALHRRGKLIIGSLPKQLDRFLGTSLVDFDRRPDSRQPVILNDGIASEVGGNFVSQSAGLLIVSDAGVSQRCQYLDIRLR